MDQNLLLSRRSALALAAGAMLSPRTAFAAPSNPVLVELFTSQGCSSCPPADRVAAQIAKDPNTFVVSFNVDYWDYLGWRDTLAKPEYSKRQYDYAKSRGDGAVYTPQMVINGATHVVGSHRGNVNAQITSARASKTKVPLTMAFNRKEITVRIPESDASGEATLWLMAVESKVHQKIERGENAGEDIVYVNVVRNLVPATMWKGQAYFGSWMRDAVMPKGCNNCIAVLQQGMVGPVLGLARV
jgi:hypothetical protein